MSLQSARRLGMLASLSLFLSAPLSTQACTVCMGDANSNVAGASNGAIFVMLGVIGLMLAATATFAYCLYRRSLKPLSSTPFTEAFSSDPSSSSHA